MAQRRVQVQDLPGAPLPNPSAAPVNKFFAPELPKPALQHIIDLSPLSNTLSQIAIDQANITGQKARQQGQTDAILGVDVTPQIQAANKEMDAEEAGRAQNQKAELQAVRSGAIPEAGAAWAHVGTLEVMGRRLATQYGDELMQHIDDVSIGVDPVTLQPRDKQSAQQVLNNVWKKYADNPLLKDFYGGKAAADVKEAIDAQFLQKAGERLGNALVDARRVGIMQETSDQFRVLNDKPGGPTAQDRQALQTYWDNNLNKRSAADGRGIILDSIKASVVAEGAIDPNLALKMLAWVGDMKVGTTTLRNDASPDGGASVIAALQHRYSDDADTAATKKNTKDKEADAAALRKADNEIVPQITAAQAALAAGKPTKTVQEIFNAFNDKVLGSKEYGDSTGAVLTHAHMLASSFDSNDFKPSMKSTIDLERIIDSGGDPRASQDLVRASAVTGAIGAPEYERLMSRIQRNEDTRGLIDSTAYSGALGAIDAAGKGHDLPEEFTAQRDTEFQNDRAAFQSAAADYAHSINGQPDAPSLMRAWLQDNSSKLTQKYQGVYDAARKNRTDAVAAIQDKTLNFRNAQPEIEAARAAGYLSNDDYQKWSMLNDARTKPEVWHAVPSYTQSENRIKDLVVASQVAQGNTATAVNTLALTSSFSDQLKAKADAWVADNINKVPGSEFQAKYADALAQITDELTGSIDKGVKDMLSTQLAAGKTATEAGKEVAFVQHDQETAASLQQARQGGDLTATAATVTASKNPLVSQDYYDRLGKFIKREDTFFGGKTTRLSVEGRAFDEAQEILARTDVADPVKAQAIVDTFAGVGVPMESILSGTLEVGHPLAQREFAAAQVAKIDAVLASKASDPKVTPAYVERLQATKIRLESIQKTVPIDVSKAKISPYTTPFFRTREELKSFSDGDPARFAAAMARLGVGTDDASRKAWIKAQIDAVDRTAPYPEEASTFTSFDAPEPKQPRQVTHGQ